jgi:hypothetical protein
MTFNPTSYFAGIGTVFVAIAVGFGGGLLLTNSAYKSEPPNRLERVASSTPLASPSAPQASPAAAQAPGAPAAAPAPVSEPNPSVPPPPQQASASLPQATTPPPVETTQAANQQQPAVANDPPPSSAREVAAKPQDQDNDARKIAERKQAERRKWAERKRRQQELENATVEVRRIDRDDVRRIDRDDLGREVVQRDIIETPRFGFFGQ